MLNSRGFSYWQPLLLIVIIAIAAILGFLFAGSAGHVIWNGGVVVGGNGHEITLHPNSKAKNPTWNELLSFLQQDNTNLIPYVDNSFVCADFGETLYNNAEKAGIRAGYVCINFDSINSASGVAYHVCNAFNTTDRGLVFIDDTGQPDGSGCDSQVENMVIGDWYTPTALFSSIQFSTMGKIAAYGITW